MTFFQLKPWHELFGTFQDITIDDDVVVATIAGSILRYPRRTPEAEFLVKHLNKEKIGRKVGIMNIETELRIRWAAGDPTTTGPSLFWKWYCKTYGVPEG